MLLLRSVIAKEMIQRRADKEKTVNRVRRTGREMRLNVQIGEYDMTDVILDLGSEVNVLTKANLGTNGETYPFLVPYTIEVIQSAKDCAPREIP